MGPNPDFKRGPAPSRSHYVFRPHDSNRARLRRLKQIARNQVPVDQLDVSTFRLPEPPPLPEPEFSIAYPDGDSDA